MNALVIFAVGSLVLLWLSRKPLRHPGAHGFYRFFAWEAILGLVALNAAEWGQQPFSPHQLASWVLMILSITLVQQGISQLRRHGRADAQRSEAGLYAFERTTTLVRSGVFGYIRHPMYASLLALAWGAFCQAPSWIGAALALCATVFLAATARADEKECAQYFGAEYLDYQRQTKMFIPGLL